MNIYKIHTHTHIRRICSSLSVKAILLLAVFAISLYAQAVGTHTFSTLHRGGGRPDTENFVFVIMGDGFTAGAGQTNFLNMAQETSDYLLNHYPFSVFRDRITIHAVQTVSANNSTGFFGYLTAGAANWQPPHPERVTEVLNQHAPATDQVMMYLFGMTAGFGAITVPGYGQILSVGRSLNFHTAYNALSVMIHEIGHSLVGLLDERNPHPVPFRESFNASRNSNSSTNRWRVWNGISNRSKDVIVRGGIFAMEPSTNPATGAEILNWRIPAPGSGDPALADGQSHPCVMRGSDNRTPTFCMTCAASIIRSMAHRLGYVHFTGDETLKHGYIPVGQTRVLDATFAGCFELETVSIPSTATQIGRFAFIRNHALREITNFAAIPQPINDSVFFQVANRQNITLRVPAGSVALFQAAPVWRDFNVVAIPGGITEPARNRLNITRTRVNTWSTQGDDIFRANHLTDGNWRNIWHSNYGGGSGSTGVGEAFVDIDLGSVQTVSSIEIDRGFRAGWSNIHSVRMFTHAESGNTFPNGQRIPNTFPANVSQTDINADFAMTGWTERTPSRTQGLAQPHTSSIDVSNNVVPWQVNNQASASAVILSFDAPITARYIRLGITNRNIHNQVAHTVISAIRAFGGEGSTLPPVEYQFSFALEGGAFVGGFTPPPSPASIITLPTAAQVSKSGYSLTGWRNQGGTDFAPGQMIALSSATTFTAQWAAPIDLTFALEGGAFAGGFTPPPSQVPAGSSITLPTAEQVSKNGYVLIGWRNQSGQDFTLGQTVALTASTTFTAQWSNIISISRVRVNSWESAGSDRFIPNSLFDNAPNTFWHARWSTGSGHGRGESLVDIDLGGVHTVNRIEVDRRLVSGQDIRAVRMFTHIGQGGEFPNGERIPANFPANVPQADIDLDFVMTGWTEIGDQARQITGLNTSNTVILTLNAPITARYIRLGIENGPVSGDPDFTQVREIRVFGESGGATSIRNRENSDNRFGILLENAIVSDVARISVITPEPATINLRIMDILGNVVFAETAAYGRVAYGRVSNPPLQNDNAIVWNLTNQSGRFVANGTYLIIVEATGSNGRVWHYRAIMGVRR